MSDAKQDTAILFEDLPTEILEKVFGFLDGESLLSSCCVSKTWNSLISELHSVWKKLCLNNAAGDLLENTTSWKAHYLQCHRLIHDLKKGTAFNHKKFIPEAFRGSFIRGLAYAHGYLIAGIHNQINVWDTKSRSLIGTHQVPPKISCLGVSDEEFILGIGQHSGHIMTWELKKDALNLLKEFFGHKEKVVCISILYRKNLMASGAEDKTVWLWELSSGNALRTLSIQTIPQEVKLFFSFSSTSLAIITSDNLLSHTWSENINDSIELKHPLPATEVQHICFLHNKVLYGGEYAGEVVLRDMKSWNEPHYFKLKTDKLIKIIAVGDYLLLAELQEPQMKLNDHALAIVDWVKGNVIGTYRMPRAMDHVVVGETCWMNGLAYKRAGETILITCSSLQASVTFDIISWK